MYIYAQLAWVNPQRASRRQDRASATKQRDVGEARA